MLQIDSSNAGRKKPVIAGKDIYNSELLYVEWQRDDLLVQAETPFWKSWRGQAFAVWVSDAA